MARHAADAVGRRRALQETYWSRFPGVYFSGDGAKNDEDGDFWLLGRVDDVMNVAGHRLSTTEIESALVSHPMVAEAAVVGAADATTGQSIEAFVILRGRAATGGGEDVVKELRDHVAKEIGAIAKPRSIMIVPDLPKTRSGKIMRRLLKDVAEKREPGDSTTLADSTVMDLIQANLATASSAEDNPPPPPSTQAELPRFCRRVAAVMPSRTPNGRVRPDTPAPRLADTSPAGTRRHLTLDDTSLPPGTRRHLVPADTSLPPGHAGKTAEVLTRRGKGEARHRISLGRRGGRLSAVPAGDANASQGTRGDL